MGTEAQAQAELVKWLHGRDWRFTATANGVMTSPMQWVQLARMGVSPGVPDLLVFEPLAGYVGVAIEMKRAGGKVTPEQTRWLRWLQERGWYTMVAFSAQQAIDELIALATPPEPMVEL